MIRRSALWSNLNTPTTRIPSPRFLNQEEDIDIESMIIVTTEQWDNEEVAL